MSADARQRYAPLFAHRSNMNAFARPHDADAPPTTAMPASTNAKIRSSPNRRRHHFDRRLPSAREVSRRAEARHRVMRVPPRLFPSPFSAAATRATVQKRARAPCC